MTSRLGYGRLSDLKLGSDELSLGIFELEATATLSATVGIEELPLTLEGTSSLLANPAWTINAGFDSTSSISGYINLLVTSLTATVSTPFITETYSVVTGFTGTSTLLPNPAIDIRTGMEAALSISTSEWPIRVYTGLSATAKIPTLASSKITVSDSRWSLPNAFEVLGELQGTLVKDISSFTTDTNDPDISAYVAPGNTKGYSTSWVLLQPTNGTVVTLDATESGFSFVLIVWLVTDLNTGTLSYVTSIKDTALKVRLNRGSTYLVEVSKYSA